MTAIRGALTDAVSVVLVGLRLALAHLPTLLAIFLTGAAVRNGVLWASVELSASHSTLAGFLLPLAPMATLTAIVLMLRVVSRSLSWASFGAAVDQPGRVGPYLGLLSSALIPFLTVYAAQGYLKEDLRAYYNAAAFEEFRASAGALYGVRADVDRTAIATGAVLVGIVATALVLRFLISRFDLPSRHVGWGLVAAYIEVIWLFLLASQFSQYQDRIWEWVKDRRFVEWVDDRWSSLVDLVGPLGRPLQAVADGVGNLLSDADAVLIIPIAWLTVGAVALGQRIETPIERRRRFIAEERLKRVPAAVRRVSHEATADIRGRFSGLGNGIRLLAIGGLLPMLMFCLVFIIARQAGNLVLELYRAVVGPMAADTAVAFSPYVVAVSDAVYSVLLVGLLAAAVDRVIRRRDEGMAAQAEQAAPLS